MRASGSSGPLVNCRMVNQASMHNLLDKNYVVYRHRCHMAAKFGVFVDEDHSRLPTSYWLPQLYKYPISHVLLLTLAHVLLLSCR